MNDLQAMLARARAAVAEIDAATLADALDGYLVVDVREPDEFAMGQIEGARNLPLSTIIPGLGPALDTDAIESMCVEERTICFYCQSGGRSLIAAFALKEAGVSDVVSLAGGIVAWRGQ